jgi:crotonobetainyl-CoA:carnitine CoA-transferase CaiB-like acyl-CoA transferase
MKSAMKDALPGFQGVRVIEFSGSGIAAAYAGWSLARLGAQVTRLVLPLAKPESTANDQPGPVQLALDVLADDKTTAPGPATAVALDALLAGCDILLCDTPQALEALAGTMKALSARWPRLVIGIATTFGLEGPYATYAGTGLDAQALSAVSWSLGEAGRAPLSLPPGIVEHQAGAMLAAGCLMGLAVRDERGSGRIVDIALADVLASYVAGNCRVYIHHNLKWQRSGRRASGSAGAYPYVILPCKDGQVCICGRTREEWTRLVQAMGNPQWAAEPRYQDLRSMGTRYPEEVDALMAPWLAQKTMAELEAIALKNNLIVSPIRGFGDVIKTPHFTQRGFLGDASVAGQAVKVPLLPFQVIESCHANATNIAAGLLATANPQPRQSAAAASAGPLAGVRVLDFGWVWSAPWVGTILGELGAQVIKVEHAMRPDNLRLSGRVFRDGKQVEGPNKEMSPMFHQINHGKLGITLNAKEPRAAELLKQLVATSDIVIENMSPGSMERTHLGYDELRAVNPRIVMLAMSAAGQFGDLAGMRAYAPTMSSFVGMEALVGYPGEQPIGALNFGLGDPNASVHGLMAVLAALRRARATGQGSYIDLSQIEALLSTLRPYLLDTQVRGRQTPPMGNRHPDMAPHGIYPAFETDAWLTLAVTSDVHWQALARLAPFQGWAQDARFQTLAGRLTHVADLDIALAAWTANQPRDALVSQLRTAGLAASPVLSIEEQWTDANYEARQVKKVVEIPVYGPEKVFSAPWRFSDFTPQIKQPGPAMGQHNDFVFGELLGLPSEEIAALKASGVIA